MSTAIEIAPPSENMTTRFPYGWRDVQRRRPDGTTWLDQIPLTLEDNLHPQLGDHLLEGPTHDMTRMYLVSVFRFCLAGDPSAFVLSDCGIEWDDPRFPRGHCPDVAVLTGLAKPLEILNGDKYYVETFGKKPRAIVEVVSHSNRVNDVEDKFEAYHALQIPLYIIVDRENRDADWKIVPYQFTPSRYFKLATDERGRFWIDFLGIWLGVEQGRVVCYDGKTDKVIGDYTEIAQQRDAESQRAEAEKQRAETEKQRAEAEKQRAEAEKQRAEQEKQRADAAELRLNEMAAELARLRGQ